MQTMRISKSRTVLLQSWRGVSSLSRQFVMAGDSFRDKERGEENVRFRQEDERLLRQLLSKVKSQADSADSQAAEEAKTVEIAALREIVGKYNVSQADLDKLVAWKHS